MCCVKAMILYFHGFHRQMWEMWFFWFCSIFLTRRLVFLILGGGTSSSFNGRCGILITGVAEGRMVSEPCSSSDSLAAICGWLGFGCSIDRMLSLVSLFRSCLVLQSFLPRRALIPWLSKLRCDWEPVRRHSSPGFLTIIFDTCTGLVFTHYPVGSASKLASEITSS